MCHFSDKKSKVKEILDNSTREAFLEREEVELSITSSANFPEAASWGYLLSHCEINSYSITMENKVKKNPLITSYGLEV